MGAGGSAAVWGSRCVGTGLAPCPLAVAAGAGLEEGSRRGVRTSRTARRVQPQSPRGLCCQDRGRSLPPRGFAAWRLPGAFHVPAPVGLSSLRRRSPRRAPAAEMWLCDSPASVFAPASGKTQLPLQTAPAPRQEQPPPPRPHTWRFHCLAGARLSPLCSQGPSVALACYAWCGQQDEPQPSAQPASSGRFLS